jgi:hypothetical protein
MTDKQFHNRALKIFNDTAHRKDFIEGVLYHKLWEHPYAHRHPPYPDDIATIDINEWFNRKEDDTWVTSILPEGDYHDCIFMEFVYVNPLNETIEKNITLNTAFRVWIEAGGWADMSTEENLNTPIGGWNDNNKWIRCHDTRLDCGAENIEMALIELGVRLNRYYNDDGSEKTK